MEQVISPATWDNYINFFYCGCLPQSFFSTIPLLLLLHLPCHQPICHAAVPESEFLQDLPSPNFFRLACRDLAEKARGSRPASAGQVEPEPGGPATFPCRCRLGISAKVRRWSRSRLRLLEPSEGETQRGAPVETEGCLLSHRRPLPAQGPAWADECAAPGSCDPCGGAEGGPLGRRPCGRVGTRRAAPRCGATGGFWGHMSGETVQGSGNRCKGARRCVSSCGSSTCHC